MEAANQGSHAEPDYYDGLTDEEVIELTIDLLSEYISDDIKKMLS